MPDGDELQGPLSHIRVVDLARARSGPTCVRQLADLGADVVQIADPTRGDLRGSDAANLHRNKRSIVLDLRSDDGKAAFLRLIDGADVFVENMRPSVKHRLGIGPDVLLARNPRLVYASLSGFGQTGPYAERPGVDQIAQGMGGLMSVTGPPGTGPWRAGIAISDTASGTFLTQGVLAALIARERTGRGQWLHTSLLESMIDFLDFQACRWLTDGEVPQQQGNDHPTFFPMGCYRTADGYVNIGGLRKLEIFLDAIDARDLLDDPRFADGDARKTNRVAFNAACEERLLAAPTDHWVARFNAADIPAGPVYAIDEVFADPQVKHLDVVRTVDHAAGEPVQVLRYPVTFSDTPTSVRRGVPVAGMHTRAVLTELGYPDAEIDALLASGAAAESVSATGWLR
ncbi:MAG TPA: CaiB/BaiF CoA-transferase family protein [Acidimicrobiales bacterium]|nr:CaiB/BaiF CoA-transferase family protein [Acidimicrobiales bacterium]